MDRREFLAAMASIAVVGCRPRSVPFPSGGFVDDGGARGHALRDLRSLPPVRRRETVPVVIVGGGIAGLSAAWWLRRRGMDDFVLLEMEPEAGGNARGGENEVSAYPWAAHYVPVPGPEAGIVRTLFEGLGVLREGEWEETALCFAPKERLFRYGRWTEGLEEPLIESRADREEMRRFRERMAELREGGEFTIPSSRGRRPSPLDSLSMAAWLEREGFRSGAVRWLADYACRDDYGALSSGASAWAGIHYFASRAEEEEGPLTWPEGNARITRLLQERLGERVRTDEPVLRVSGTPGGALVRTRDTEYRAESVIFAAPSFLAPRLVEGAPAVDFTYSPWLTANLTLERWPRSAGAEPTWDNVLHDSPSLGYVVATHQHLASHHERTVWTYYWALAHEPPADARRRLLADDWRTWTERILADLERAHPDLRECVSRVDLCRMGHAMIRPTPGFLSSPARSALLEATGPVFYAHSDVSGLSLFEEALDGGVRAADAALARLGG